MPYYRIIGRDAELGCYEAETREHAIAAMWQDAGYNCWVEDGELCGHEDDVELDPDQLRVERISDDEMLEHLSRDCQVCSGVLDELPDLCEMHIRELTWGQL